MFLRASQPTGVFLGEGGSDQLRKGGAGVGQGMMGWGIKTVI